MNSPTATRPRHSLKFLSWNINHSRDKCEGAKVDIAEIRKLFNNHDIFALQETKGVVNLSNYHCYNSNRKGSKSGGVCIGVHKSLKPGVTTVPVHSSEDIIAIKLKASFFDLDRDTYLVNVYDSPKNGSFKKRTKSLSPEDDCSTLEHLEEFLASISLDDDVILLGDFNARTGTLEDMLSDANHLPDADLNEQYFKLLPKRSNSDHKLNANGRPFIELLQTTGLAILNGRTLGDIFGEPTCIQRQGVSTVDYICVSANLHDRVRHFSVGNISQYSDHRALSMSISTNPTKRITENSDSLNIHDAPKAFKWVKSNDTTLDTAARFRIAQEQPTHIERIDSLLNQPVNTTSEAVRLNQEVVALYHDLTSPITTRKSGKPPNKKKWFDQSCRAAKKEANRADRNAGRNPHSIFLRDQHFLKKKEYRAIRRSKKGKFLYDMNARINEAGNVNWTALKQLSEQNKDEEPFDIYDLLSFHSFFNNLYNRKCSKNHHSGNQKPSQVDTHHLALVEELNLNFTVSEINEVTKKLKNKKKRGRRPYLQQNAQELQ